MNRRKMLLQAKPTQESPNQQVKIKTAPSHSLEESFHEKMRIEEEAYI
jgi:hypothetical protein